MAAISEEIMLYIIVRGGMAPGYMCLYPDVILLCMAEAFPIIKVMGYLLFKGQPLPLMVVALQIIRYQVQVVLEWSIVEQLS